MPQIVRKSKCCLCIATMTGILGFAVATLCAGDDSAAVDSMQKVVSQWAKVRAETVKLESSWEAEQELMRSTLQAMQERAQVLADSKKTLLAKTAGERDALTKLAAEDTTIHAAIDAADTRLKQISAQVVALRPALPPRLSQALELPYRSLANPKISPGERMQFATTILNRCLQFNNSITYDEEPLSLPGQEGARLVEVMYWGASHAYALDRAAGKAYFGSPGPQNWTWEPVPAAAKAVADLIAVYRDKADPHFIEVPAHFSNASPN